VKCCRKPRRGYVEENRHAEQVPPKSLICSRESKAVTLFLAVFPVPNGRMLFLYLPLSINHKCLIHP